MDQFRNIVNLTLFVDFEKTARAFFNLLSCQCHHTRHLNLYVSFSFYSASFYYCNSILNNIPKSRNKQAVERSELPGQGCDPFSTILQCHTFVKIPTLAPCSIQNKIQNMHPHI